MRAAIVYDSVYGNTEKIARAIGDALDPAGEIGVFRPGAITPGQLTGVRLLIVGSPTQGGRPLPSIQKFLAQWPAASFKGLKMAAFDTRISAKWVSIFGYAAVKIADHVKKKGALLIVPAEGFFVQGKEGPLSEGEYERATLWGKKLTV